MPQKGNPVRKRKNPVIRSAPRLSCWAFYGRVIRTGWCFVGSSRTKCLEISDTRTHTQTDTHTHTHTDTNTTKKKIRKFFGRGPTTTEISKKKKRTGRHQRIFQSAGFPTHILPVALRWFNGSVVRWLDGLMGRTRRSDREVHGPAATDGPWKHSDANQSGRNGPFRHGPRCTEISEISAIFFLESLGFSWVLLGFFRKFFRVLLGFTFTGFYWILLGFIRFYWVLLGFTEFYWVLQSFIGFYPVKVRFTWFYWVLLGFLLNFTRFYWVFYWISLDFTGFFTEFHSILLGFTEFY